MIIKSLEVKFFLANEIETESNLNLLSIECSDHKSKTFSHANDQAENQNTGHKNLEPGG